MTNGFQFCKLIYSLPACRESCNKLWDTERKHSSLYCSRAAGGLSGQCSICLHRSEEEEEGWLPAGLLSCLPIRRIPFSWAGVTPVHGVGLERRFPSGAGGVVFLSAGEAQAYVGAGALQKGRVWVASVLGRALTLRKSQLQSEPC